MAQGDGHLSKGQVVGDPRWEEVEGRLLGHVEDGLHHRLDDVHLEPERGGRGPDARLELRHRDGECLAQREGCRAEVLVLVADVDQLGLVRAEVLEAWVLQVAQVQVLGVVQTLLDGGGAEHLRRHRLGHEVRVGPQRPRALVHRADAARARDPLEVGEGLDARARRERGVAAGEAQIEDRRDLTAAVELAHPLLVRVRTDQARLAADEVVDRRTIVGLLGALTDGTQPLVAVVSTRRHAVAGEVDGHFGVGVREPQQVRLDHVARLLGLVLHVELALTEGLVVAARVAAVGHAHGVVGLVVAVVGRPRRDLE
mmetsp:Transcript_15164/g.35992  ORF Transcript_15164/g.35992 Transcript_15164/m.35992 type:complete len:313 (-) Transcript_15164:294-1232(-)